MVESVLCPVLVRRDDQLATLEGALLTARRGDSRFVLLAGEAGMGKTRIASELAAQARKLGSNVLWGGCSEAELSLPYLPFVEAIGNYLGLRATDDLVAQLGPARRELAQIFPQLSDGTTPDTGDPAQAKLRLFEAFVALLGAAAEDGLLLVIEDVHWADSSTLELLDHISRRLAALSALVVVTYRSDEIHRRHALLPSLQAWRRSRIAETVSLESLPPGGVAEMIAAIFDTDDVADEFRDFMYARSEGNPFVLEEMLKEALERGDIFRTEQGWDRKALDELRIPDTVRDTILVRLERLAAEHAVVLQAAAVLGRTFDYSTLLAVSDAAASSVQAALEAALAQQLLEELDAGGYRWRHALTQEAVYTDTIAPRRQQIHSRAADVLATRPAARPVELASHLLDAGRFAEAVPACLRSADEAEAALAFSDAISLLERALPYVEDPLERARIVRRIGRAHWLNDDPAAAQSFLESAVAALEELGEAVEAASARLVLGRCYWERSQARRALHEFEQARDVLEAVGPSAELALAHMRIAGQHAFELDYEQCTSAAKRAVELAEQAGAEFERIWSLSFYALGLVGTGEIERGLAVLDESFEQASAAGYWLIAWNAGYNDLWFRTRMMQDELEERLERVVALPPAATMVGATASLGRSYVLMARGNVPVARETAEEGLAEWGRGEKVAWRLRVQVALTLVELGLIDAAARVLPPVSERTEAQDLVYDSPAQIRFRLARGELDEAVERAREILALAEKFRSYRETLAIGAEAFVAAGLLDDAQALVDVGRVLVTDAGSAFVDDAQGRVVLARGDHAGAIQLLRRAIATSSALGYRLVELRARVALAQALVRAGDVASAQRELETVAAEADRLGARLVRSEAAAAAAAAGITLPHAGGAEEEAPAEQQVVALGERLVTSLFADVRDSTGLTAEAAPAELAERLAALYRFAKSQVVRNHGIVDKFAGDAVMATFNVTGARVDHPVQALRTALALRDKAPLLGLELGIGIAVGPAVLGRGADDGNIAVTGLSTNLAARLQAAAPAGQILLSEEAHRRVEQWLEAQGLAAEREELDLRGFDGTQVAYRLPEPVARA